jgi:hypothetical protein
LFRHEGDASSHPIYVKRAGRPPNRLHRA